MINSSSAQPYFAGKKREPQKAFKAGIVGWLLATAGGATASRHPHNAVDNIITTPAPADSLHLTHAPHSLINRPKEIDWQTLIEEETSETKAPVPHRKLLASATVRKSPPPPVKRQATKAPPPPAKLSAEQAANAAALKLLQQEPFAPTDINLFSTSVFPQGKPMKPVPVTPVNETAIHTTLKELFNKRFKGDAAKIKAGLAVYNDPVLKAKVPHPKLRAAIAALKGTASDGAIAAYKSAVFSGAKFQVNNVRPDAVASSVRPFGASQMEVWVDPEFEGEDFRLLLDVMAHEAMHQDIQVKDTEELIAHATTLLEYAKMLTLYPLLAQSGTNLSRYRNGMLIDRLNTRTKEGKLSLFTPQKNTIPGSAPPYATIAAVNGVSSISSAVPTPGNPYLRSVLKRVTGKDVANPNFDAKTLKLLDENQIYLSPSELITIAKAMKLKINPVPAASPRGLLEEPEAPAPGPTFEELDDNGLALAPESAPASAPAPVAEHPEANRRKLSRRLFG